MKFNRSNKKQTENNAKVQDNDSSDEALRMCRAIQTGQLDKYLKYFDKCPKEETINIFLSIITSKDSWLPVLFQNETPPTIVDGISFDSIQNRVNRILTKITLLLLVKDKSQKLYLWQKIEPQWIEYYIIEIKHQVTLFEAIAQQFTDAGQRQKATEISEKIDQIKKANEAYKIDW
ncbi:MAG: hypothetical protein PHF74_06845 [Dehalococcoidales bacterium]|nr:hypothetical protein [Dehalococcoidales bacterium]